MLGRTLPRKRSPQVVLSTVSTKQAKLTKEAILRPVRMSASQFVVHSVLQSPLLLCRLFLEPRCQLPWLPVYIERIEAFYIRVLPRQSIKPLSKPLVPNSSTKWCSTSALDSESGQSPNRQERPGSRITRTPTASLVPQAVEVSPPLTDSPTRYGQQNTSKEK